MADKQFKIVGTKYYVYPDTELEASFMAGEASFPEGYELYMNVTAFFTVLGQYTENLGHIHQYDYYLLCVKTPEWAPEEGPEPPTPTTVEVTFVDESGMDMGVEAYYLDNPEETIDVWTGEPVLVDNGRAFILASDHPSYNVTTTEGITFEDYDVMQGQIKVIATADGTVTFINGGGYGIKVTDLDNAGWLASDWNWQPLPARIPVGTHIRFAVRNYVYTAESQETHVSPISPWDSQNALYPYEITMPTEPVEISVVERPDATLTINNPDSVVFGLYAPNDGWQSFQSGDKLRTDYRQYNLYVDNPNYDATITGANVIHYEPKTNPDGWEIFFVTDQQYNAVTIDIEEHIPVYSEITLINNDSISYDVDPNTIDFNSVEDRTQFDIYVNDLGYQLTSDVEGAITSEERDWDNNRWKYSIKMPAEDMTLTITVRPVDPEISWSSYQSQAYTGDTNTFPTLSNPHNVGPIEYFSSNEQAATIDSSTGAITLANVAYGNYEETYITARFQGDSQYYASYAKYTLKVCGGKDPQIAWSTDYCQATIGGSNSFPTLSNPNSLSVTYRQGDDSIATIDSQGNVTLVGEGMTTIGAWNIEDGTYFSNKVEYTLMVIDPRKQLYTMKNQTLLDITSVSDQIWNVTTNTPLDPSTKNCEPGDVIAILNQTDSTFDANVFLFSNMNKTATQLTTTQSTHTLDGTNYYTVDVTLPNDIQNQDVLIFVGPNEGMINLTLNGTNKTDDIIYANYYFGWWPLNYDWSTRVRSSVYPENAILGLESRDGQHYTLNPALQQSTGWNVGTYVYTTSSDLDITLDAAVPE